jgi:hypothetical protein
MVRRRLARGLWLTSAAVVPVEESGDSTLHSCQTTLVSLLDRFPEPVVDDFLARSWLPIVGAGFSKNALLAGAEMPDWAQLSDLLARELPGYTAGGDPTDVLSAFQERYDRARLITRLTALLHVEEARPGPAHRAFCQLAFDIVLTTNFDFLLDHQYDASWPPCMPVIDETMLTQRVPTDRVQLVKLHGDLHHPHRLVATEEDYDLFVSANPLMANYVANLLVTRTPVLVGYSLSDPDVRGLWNVIGSRLGRLRRKAYAILVGADASTVARFGRRGVDVIDLPQQPEGYGATLAMAFDELRALWERRFGDIGRPTDDEVANELTLPLDERSRLCFVSVPLRLAPWYRRFIFPVLQRAGLVPVTRDEIVLPGRAALAAVQGLLARARLALADPGTYTTAHELEAALEALTPSKVFIVTDAPDELPATARQARVFLRRPEHLEEPASLVADIEGSLPIFSPSLVSCLGDSC